MKDISKFFKIFKLREIIETILLIVIGYLLIDMFNVPTFLIEKYETSIIIALIIITIFLILNKKIISLIKINVFNYLDLILVSELISTTLYIFFSRFILYSSFKLTICILIELIVIFIIIIRLLILFILDNKIKEERQFNVYDIRKLYKNEIDNNNDLIFLEEKDVDYDLLKRNKIIGDLFNSINYCKNKERFIISLTGPWQVQEKQPY